MDRGKMPSTGRGTKNKAPQHPQDIFALGSKATVPSSSEKRNIHKPSTSGAERKREQTTFGSQPPSKRSRIGSPAESVGGCSLEVDPVDLVPSVLHALDTHNSDKLLGLLTGSIRLLKSQRSKPDPILCMSMLYLTKIRPNMFAHDVVTQSLCSLLKREQGAAFKSKGNPLVFVLACNMLYAGHRDSSSWPDTFIKVYIEDALNERWWVECGWCKCLVENIVTAFRTKTPPSHLMPTDSALGTMSPSGSGSPLMGTADEETDNTELEYTVFPRYSSSYEAVEGLVLEAIKDQLQRRAAPDAIGKGFLKLLSATCGFPEIRMIAASRLEAWLHSGKLWRCGQELLAHVCCNAACSGPCAARDHEVLAQLARMRLKTKPLQQAYQACLREMVSDSPALLRSVVTHTIYNELSAVRSPNNMAVLYALVQAQPQLVPAATAATYQELLFRPEDYLRPLRALTRECVRAARADVQALLPLARGLAQPPTAEPPTEVRERAFSSLADLLACCCLVTASHCKHVLEYKQQLTLIQSTAVGWLLDVAMPVYRPTRQEFQTALNKIMFVEPVETYTKVDNWPPESERALTYRLCCEAPLPQNTLLRVIFCGLNKEIPVSPAEVFELVEQLVRRACALPPEDSPLQVDKLELADYIFQLCTFTPPDNITLPAGYTPPPLAITSLYWRGWMLLCMIAAHNPAGFAERAAATYPTLRALIETCITGKPSIEWNGSSSSEAERAEAEKVVILQLETHLATASNAKLPITEHSSRLLSQLTTLDPLGPARKPPQTIIDTLQQLSSTLRLGKLLCRQPALLLELVERHGTRRAMPWLHQLLKHDQLQLSVLPVQCLCEFLSTGGAGGSGKAGELCAHLRHTLATSGSGARAVLGFYLQRLAYPHASTRAPARRGLKLVLGQSTDDTELDYNADVSPEEFLPILPTIRHWDMVQEEAIARIRTACLIECVPSHVAAYIIFLSQHAYAITTEFMLDLSQLLMERMSIMGAILPAAEAREQPRGQDAATRDMQQRTLHALTTLFYTYMQKVRSGDWTDDGAELPGVRLTLQWAVGESRVIHSNIAHASIKLLCYGPQQYDTNQEMYQWLQSLWLGPDAPQILDSDEDALLPDWLRLHLVRSARPKLLEAGLRSLPSHKLALFIQTFGMPVVSMNALLSALDACPVSALSRLGVERAYMTQLLSVQRARGATAGRAFASALRLRPRDPIQDDNLFEEEPLPEEIGDPWEEASSPLPLQPVQVFPLLETAFAGKASFTGDLDTGLTQLNASITEELKHPKRSRPYFEATVSFLQAACGHSEVINLMVLRPAHAAPLLRTMLPAAHQIRELATSLLQQVKCESGAVVTVLRAYSKSKAQELTVPASATMEELIAALESASPSTLEALGSRIIETQNSQLIVDVIGMLLENHQNGKYDVKVKTEVGTETSGHTLSKRGLGCGLLLDWLAELQRDTLHDRQMRLMFESGGAAWRPLLVTLLVHRASWTTLHNCLTTLLQPNGNWAPSAVLDFAETLVESGRVWQGRENTARQHDTGDTLRLDHTQLEILIRYIVLEAEQAESVSGIEGMRLCMERRLPMLLRCAGSALLAAALAAHKYSAALLLLLYMKVPKILKLLQECEPRPPIAPILPSEPALRAAAGASTAASDRVAHTLLTAIAAAANSPNRDTNKIWRMEALLHSVWSRVEGAGQRALPLAGALLRGAVTCNTRHHHHLLAVLELLPDDKLFAPHLSEEVHAILDCLVGYARAAGGAQHRLAGVLRRYLAARPMLAHPLLHRHKDTIQSIPALSSLTAMEVSLPASAAPPPAALAALQRRHEAPDHLATMIQEIESWGIRRGGSWGGAGGGAAGAVLRAVAPLCAHSSPALRTAALSLLAKLLPATTDTSPGVQAILECLDSSQPEIAASCLEKMPDLIAGVQEHASIILARVFELGMQSRQPIEQCLAKCVTTINLQRGC